MTGITHPYRKHFTLNWRLMVIHFLACWFTAAAFYTWAHLGFLPLIDAVRNIRPESTNTVIGQLAKYYADPAGIMAYFLIIPTLAALAGVLLALIIAIRQCVRQHWAVINTIIAWILVLLTLRFIDIQGSLGFYRITARLLGNSFLEFLLTGIVLALMGIGLFFHARSIRFIAGGQPTRRAQVSAGVPAG